MKNARCMTWTLYLPQIWSLKLVLIQALAFYGSGIDKMVSATPRVVRILLTHPVIFQSQTLNLWTTLSHLHFTNHFAMSQSQTINFHPRILGNLRHLVRLTVILPPLQDYLKIIKPSRPATQEHHHVDRLFGAWHCAQTLFVGVWLYLRYQ